MGTFFQAFTDSQNNLSGFPDTIGHILLMDEQKKDEAQMLTAMRACWDAQCSSQGRNLVGQIPAARGAWCLWNG